MKSKKIFTNLLYLMVLLGSSSLSGCTHYNPTIEVSFIDENNEVIDVKNVDMLKATNVPELNYTIQGKNFRGWALTSDAESPKIKPGATLKYSLFSSQTNNYKDYIVDNKLNMYAVWLDKPEVCIAYDGYEKVSGLNEDVIAGVKASLNSALAEEFGFDVNVNWRKYDSEDIVEKCNNISKHGDVDITFCFQDTINKPSYGNLGIRGLILNYSFVGKIRTLGRMNNKDTTLFVYNWLQDPKNLGYKERVSEHDLVLGWGWAGNSTAATRSIDYQTFKTFQQALEKHLNDEGYSNLDIIYRPYRNTPANEAGAAINADGDCDILLGFGSNIPVFGDEKNDGNVSIFSQKTSTINGNKRYHFMLNIGSDLTRDVFNWIVSDEATEALTRKEHKHIIIGFDMRSTSGINETIITNYTNALQNYISASNLDYTFEIKEYTKDTIGEDMLNDNVDISIGMGSNFQTKFGLLFCQSKSCTIGTATGRRIVATVGNTEVEDIYNWTISDGLTSLNAKV